MLVCLFICLFIRFFCMCKKKCRKISISFRTMWFCLPTVALWHRISSQCTYSTRIFRVSRLAFFAQVFYCISFINYVSSARTELDVYIFRNETTIDWGIWYVLEYGAKKKINANWEINRSNAAAPKMCMCTAEYHVNLKFPWRKKRRRNVCDGIQFFSWKNFSRGIFSAMFVLDLDIHSFQIEFQSIFI